MHGRRVNTGDATEGKGNAADGYETSPLAERFTWIKQRQLRRRKAKAVCLLPATTDPSRGSKRRDVRVCAQDDDVKRRSDWVEGTEATARHPRADLRSAAAAWKAAATSDVRSGAGEGMGCRGKAGHAWRWGRRGEVARWRGKAKRRSFGDRNRRSQDDNPERKSALRRGRIRGRTRSGRSRIRPCPSARSKVGRISEDAHGASSLMRPLHKPSHGETAPLRKLCRGEGRRWERREGGVR